MSWLNCLHCLNESTNRLFHAVSSFDISGIFENADGQMKQREHIILDVVVESFKLLFQEAI